MKTRSLLAAGGLLVALAATRVAAIEQRPLPVFHVTTADGSLVSSAQFNPSGQWLLIYVAPGSPSCDRLLVALKGWVSPNLLERTVIVVGGSTDGAQAYLAKALPPEVGAIAWYADPQDEAWAALRLTGAPVLVGVKEKTIQWSISGVLNDPKVLESAVRTWVGQ